MSTDTRFEKEAKGNSEMAYCVLPNCVTSSFVFYPTSFQDLEKGGVHGTSDF